jgi:hypothetical protein
LAIELLLPGIEYLITVKWAVSAGAAFDLLGKFGGSENYAGAYHVL